MLTSVLHFIRDRLWERVTGSERLAGWKISLRFSVWDGEKINLEHSFTQHAVLEENVKVTNMLSRKFGSP